MLLCTCMHAYCIMRRPYTPTPTPTPVVTGAPDTAGVVTAGGGLANFFLRGNFFLMRGNFLGRKNCLSAHATAATSGQTVIEGLALMLGGTDSADQSQASDQT